MSDFYRLLLGKFTRIHLNTGLWMHAADSNALRNNTIPAAKVQLNVVGTNMFLLFLGNFGDQA
jgi:hypothetical protein